MINGALPLKLDTGAPCSPHDNGTVKHRESNLRGLSVLALSSRDAFINIHCTHIPILVIVVVVGIFIVVVVTVLVDFFLRIGILRPVTPVKWQAGIPAMIGINIMRGLLHTISVYCKRTKQQ
jgi:hypothetical protein